jgi:hypothetical protein
MVNLTYFVANISWTHVLQLYFPSQSSNLNSALFHNWSLNSYIRMVYILNIKIFNLSKLSFSVMNMMSAAATPSVRMAKANTRLL